MSSENKCLGCGILLQNESNNRPGYVPSFDQHYCQRCFKLIHYGDTSTYIRKSYMKELKNTLNEYTDALVVLVVDCYESLILKDENFLDIFKNHEVLLLVNKMDLLPKNIREERIMDVYKKVFQQLNIKYPNIKDIILTHYKDSSFKDLFFETVSEYKKDTILFAGKSNAGKSTIINRLMGNNSLTVSIYPGTTVGSLKSILNGYTFIDTPGIDDNDNLLTHFSNSDLKKYLDYQTVKPLIYQIYEKQCYFFSKIFELDVDPKGNCSLIFESLRDDIHRTGIKNRDKYLTKKNYDFTLLPWSRKEYLVKGSRSFLIKGFGIIRIKGNARITFSINDKIQIYECEVFI